MNNDLTIMEFPEDIWKYIFAYFHSCYRKPYHYVAILEDNIFYMCRQGILNLQKYNLPNPVNSSSRYKITNSFYIQIILADNINSTSRYKLKINRRTACKEILNDFKGIFEEYKTFRIQPLQYMTY